MSRRLTRIAATAFVPLLLPACAQRQVAIVETPPPPQVVAIVPPPAAPVGLTASLVLPPANPDGSFRTINWGITPPEMVWHVRGALNVAALGCRGASQAALIAAYNGLLKDQKVALAAADKAAQAHDRAAYGKTWETAHDQSMTRLYNFFAQPFAQARFCETAAAIVTTARQVPAGQMQVFAATALVSLEAPFTDFYRQAAEYRRDLASWEAGRQSAGQAASQAAGQAPIGLPTGPRIEPNLAGLDRVATNAPR